MSEYGGMCYSGSTALPRSTFVQSHSCLYSGRPARFTPYGPSIALGPSWVFVVPVSLLPPPPPPFSIQPYVAQYPLSQQERILVVAPLAFTPTVSPVPDFLTA